MIITEKELKNEIINILKVFKNNVFYSMGFGSFWQDKKKFTQKSDIDILIMLRNEPTLSELKKFNDKIMVLSKKINYKISPQLFVGKISDIFKGTDNVFRVLTIFGKKQKIVEIINIDKIDIYDYFFINISKINIIDSIKIELFRLTRLYNKDFSKYNYGYDLYRCNELKNMYNAIEIYNSIFKSKKLSLYLACITPYVNNFLINENASNLNNIIRYFNMFIDKIEKIPKIISVMGIDGSGKTTQVKLLKKKLCECNIKVMSLKLSEIKVEITENEIMYYLKKIENCDEKSKKFLIECLVARKKINNNIEKFFEYDYIIFDRYLESLQGKSYECLSGRFIFFMIFKNIIYPNYNFNLEISPHEAIQRIKKTKVNDKISFKQLEYMSNFYNTKFDFYDKINVDASKSKIEIMKEIFEIIN